MTYLDTSCIGSSLRTTQVSTVPYQQCTLWTTWSSKLLFKFCQISVSKVSKNYVEGEGGLFAEIRHCEVKPCLA